MTATWLYFDSLLGNLSLDRAVFVNGVVGIESVGQQGGGSGGGNGGIGDEGIGVLVVVV